MNKVNYKSLVFIPTSKNISEFPEFTNDNGEVERFDVGDDGKAKDEVDSNLQADALLLQLLSNMDDRNKIILLYQVLREAGYNLNHDDCARTLNLSREHYMSLVKDVKNKSVKIIQVSYK